LASGSELGRNLRAQKESIERLGVPTEVRVRHGMVLAQIFAEVGKQKHDLIVTGSSPTRGPLGHYIMGDLTRSIVNRANVPVLVARAAKSSEGERRGFWAALKQIFAPAPGGN
jgi:nucleotide-binding universal stress UspA family protein